MSETQDAKAEPAGAASRAGEATTAKRATLAANIKAWADATFAFTKAFVIVATTATLITLIVLAIKRDQSQTNITIDLDPRVEKALLDLGAYVDLRSMLIDETNAKIQGVTSFISPSLFENLGLQGPYVGSLKPFGLDISTNDLTTMVRNFIGGPPSFRIQIDLACAPGPCDDLSKAANSTPNRDLVLLINLRGPETRDSLSFRLAAKPAALRRALQEAMHRASEKLLEQADPLMASVYYLNAPNFLAFDDEKQLYLRLAAQATFRTRDKKKDEGRRCLGAVVFANTLTFAGDPAGFTQLEQIAKSKLPICRIHAWTDYVNPLRTQLCVSLSRKESKNQRQQLIERARVVMSDLDTEVGPSAARIALLRVKEFKATVELNALLYGEDDEALAAVCDEKSTSHVDGSADNRYERIIGALALVDESFLEGMEQRTLLFWTGHLRDYVQRLIPRTQPTALAKSLHKLSRAIAGRIEADTNPARLFLLDGEILLDLASLMREAETAPQDARTIVQYMESTRGEQGIIADSEIGRFLEYYSQDFLRQAQSSFEHAAASKSPFPWIDPSSNIEGMMRIGDVHFAKGDLDGSKNAYANAIKLFADHHQQLREFAVLVKVATRWITVQGYKGACGEIRRRSKVWDDAWRPLGGNIDHDFCILLNEATQSDLSSLGLMGVIAPVISSVAKVCLKDLKLQAGAADTKARFELLRCLSSLETDRTIKKFLSDNNSESINRHIMRALEAD